MPAVETPKAKALPSTSQEGGGTLSPTKGMVAKLSKDAMSTCTMVTRRALTLRATRPMRMISMAMASALMAVSISPQPKPALLSSGPESSRTPGKASAMPTQAIKCGGRFMTSHCSRGTSGT